jgi:hypothetical protein
MIPQSGRTEEPAERSKQYRRLAIALSFHHGWKREVMTSSFRAFRAIPEGREGARRTLHVVQEETKLSSSGIDKADG